MLHYNKHLEERAYNSYSFLFPEEKELGHGKRLEEGSQRSTMDIDQLIRQSRVAGGWQLTLSYAML